MHPNRHSDHQPAHASNARPSAAAEAGLIDAGREMLTPVRALLARRGSPLLTICRARNDAADVVRLFAWTARLEPSEEIAAEQGPAQAMHAAIRAAGARALRQVALRWPPYALPPVIGLVSDGTGLAISGEQPSGLCRQWLTDQLGRGSPASVIIPFDPSGIGALLSPSPAGRLPRGCN